MVIRPCRHGLLLAVLALAGCQGAPQLIATPNVLRQLNPEQVYAAAAPDAQRPEMEVIYATDRAIVSQDDAGPVYGYGRDKRLAFGTAVVTVRPEPMSWKEFIKDSTSAERKRDYSLEAGQTRELGAFDPRWDKLQLKDNGFQLASEVEDDMHRQQKVFHETMSRRLAGAAAKDVYVFVHGYNDTFEDAVFRAGQVWHFMGRVGVPVVYTWPAGYGGIRGYAYDRESGEYTVHHFRHFLRLVASCPDVERIHIVAHSRGTDVAINALRELNIAYQAQHKSTQEELKLENLVLAAPDLDEDVFMQRFIAENLLKAAKRTTIYASQSDKALELADLVFASRKRVGTLGPRDFSPKVRAALAKLPNLQFIECRVSSYSSSHDYVFAHPAALSDLILVLRDRRDPGAANGRPLLQPVEGIWELHNDYLLKK